MNKISNFGSKENLLKNIISAEPMVYGAAPTSSNTVKFAYHATESAVDPEGGKAIANGVAGQIVFNKLGDTGAIVVNGELVSSKILDVIAVQKSGDNVETGTKTVTVKYVGANNVISTADFEVIDQAAVESLIAKCAVSAEGDNYVNAEVKTGEGENNKKVIVSTNVATIEDGKLMVGDTELADSSVALADAGSFKDYVDANVAAGTTEIVQLAGVTVNSSIDSTDGHNIYSIGANLVFEYNAAVPASEGVPATPATITLKSAAREDEMQVTYGTVNVSDIIGNGVLESSSYEKTTGILTLNFKQADGSTKAETINLADMLDIDDVVIGEDSANYLNVTLAASDGTTDTSSNMTLDVKIKKMAEVSDAIEGTEDVEAQPAITGLADALDVRNFVLEQVAAVDADGDDYVSASYDSENSKITVATDVQNVTASAGTRGTWSVTDAGVASLAGETAPSISGVEKSLMDGKQAMESVKTYVDAVVAAEAAERAAKIEAAVKALDVEDTSVDFGNVSFDFSETDGKVDIHNAQIHYATVTGTRHTDETETEPAVAANLVVDNDTSTALVTGQDIVSVKNYVDDKLLEMTSAQDSSITLANNYVKVYVEMNDGALDKTKSTLDVSIASLVDGTDWTGTKLLDAVAAKAYIDASINALDVEETNVTEADDTNKNVSFKYSETDGKVAISNLAVLYTATTTANASTYDKSVDNMEGIKTLPTFTVATEDQTKVATGADVLAGANFGKAYTDAALTWTIL